MNEISRTLDDIADDVRKHLSGAVKNIIKAGQALQEGRDEHKSDNAFHEWCVREFPDLESRTRYNIMQVGKRFGQQFISDHLPITVLYELAAPAIPDELVEDFISSEEPVKVKEVKQAKEGYKRLKEDPDLADVAQDLQAGRKTPREAAQEAWERSEEKRKHMEENPQVIDFEAAVKSKEHYNIRTSAISFVVAMEQMNSKSDVRDIKRELILALQTDPLNIKVPALFAMREVLEELCNEFDQPQVNKSH